MIFLYVRYLLSTSSELSKHVDSFKNIFGHYVRVFQSCEMPSVLNHCAMEVVLVLETDSAVRVEGQFMLKLDTPSWYVSWYPESNENSRLAWFSFFCAREVLRLYMRRNKITKCTQSYFWITYIIVQESNRHPGVRPPFNP